MDAVEPAGGTTVGVTYALTVGPDDVGRRIVLRRRLADGRLGDLLGELLAWTDQDVRLRDRTGHEHTVLRADVVAAKPVPPAPPRRRP